MPQIKPEDVLKHLIGDLQRIHRQSGGGPNSDEIPGSVLQNFAGEKASVEELIKGKTAIIFVWASWAPGDLRDTTYREQKQSYELLERLKSLYGKYGEDPDITFIGISLDVDAEAARAHASKQEFPWENYVVPVSRREEFLKSIRGFELPYAQVISRRGDIQQRGIESVLGSATLDDDSTTPFERVVKEDRGAVKAGSYLRYWLGESVLEMLRDFETVDIYKLTGDDRVDLGFAEYTGDLPTSIGLLFEYPVTDVRGLSNLEPAKKLATLVVKTETFSNRTGDQHYSPEYGLVFTGRSGSLTILQSEKEVEFHYNGELAAKLALSDSGLKSFNRAVEKCWSAARVKRKLVSD